MVPATAVVWEAPAAPPLVRGMRQAVRPALMTKGFAVCCVNYVRVRHSGVERAEASSTGWIFVNITETPGDLSTVAGCYNSIVREA